MWIKELNLDFIVAGTLGPSMTCTDKIAHNITSDSAPLCSLMVCRMAL